MELLTNINMVGRAQIMLIKTLEPGGEWVLALVTNNLTELCRRDQGMELPPLEKGPPDIHVISARHGIRPPNASTRAQPLILATELVITVDH